MNEVLVDYEYKYPALFFAEADPDVPRPRDRMPDLTHSGSRERFGMPVRIRCCSKNSRLECSSHVALVEEGELVFEQREKGTIVDLLYNPSFSSPRPTMPLCTLHLLRLSPGSTEQSLLEQVTSSSSATNHQVILASKPRGPVIRVSHDADRDRINGQWDLLLVLASSSTGSSGSKVQLLKDEEAFKSYIQDELVYPTGIPTRLLQSLPERSAQLQNDRGPALPYDIIGGRSSSSSSSTSDVVAPSRDSQNLELSEGLVDFAQKLLQDGANGGAGPVWMLNFLRFRQGEKDNYINYGKVSIALCARHTPRRSREC